MADLGYFSLDVMQELDQKGVYWLLAYAMDGTTDLGAVIKLIGQAMGSGCKMNACKQGPNLYQILLNLTN